ncbi:MAG TPA: hypothetical protein VGB68_07975 [Pyrinomonadaceae bacterium]
MNLTKTLRLLLVFLSISGICSAQEFTEEENWIREIAGEYCRGYRFLAYRFETFTKQDVIKAKEKLKSIKQFAPESEWEGVYFGNVALGDNGLLWSAEGGFLKFYCYHELGRLDYGKVSESPGFVEIISEKPAASTPDQKPNGKTENKLIKVKFGESHYLVPENSLQHFTTRAAGLGTSSDNYADFYWLKREDFEKKVFGLPVLPKEYKHLLRFPVETRIISVGKRQIIRNKQSTEEYNFDDIHYPVTLDAGKNRNIKPGMNFYVDDLGEWVEITGVFQKSSIGRIRRDFDENKNEQCRNGELGGGDIISCKKIKFGMKAKTKFN